MENRTDYTLQLKYNGKQTDLREIKQLKYSYKGMSSGGKTIEGPIRLEDLKIQSLGGNGAHEQEQSVIRVEVEWDGKQEQFDLQVRK